MRLCCLILILVSVLAAGCNEDAICSCSGGANPRPLTDADVIGPAVSATKPAPGGGAPVSINLSGTITYERLLAHPTGLHAMPVVEGAVLVLVEAVRHNSLDDVLASTTTDLFGDYQLSFDTTEDFYIRARAQTGTGPDVDRVIHPDTPSKVVFGLCSQIFNRASAPAVVDLNAIYNLAKTSRAGAFAILQTVRLLRELVGASFASLGPLDLFWSTGGAIAGSDTTEAGPLGNPTIFLVGGTPADPANTDHDEFDEPVIAHEWASFLMLTQSRDNNFGGPHAGEVLIPTAAYSEGLATALGCALLGNSVYRDTVGLPIGNTSVQFEFDCESGLIPPDGDAYTSEFRVARIVWDLLDDGASWPAGTDGDPVAIGKAEFLASLSALHTRTGDYEVAWLASLMQQLVDDAALSLADADTLAASQGAAFPPVGGSDSFPTPLVIGDPAQAGGLDAWSGTNPNPDLGPQANAVYRMVVAVPQTVQVTVLNLAPGYNPDMHRIDLTVHALDRTIVAADTGAAQDKGVQVALAAGTYIVRIQHRPASQGASMPTDFTVGAQ